MDIAEFKKQAEAEAAEIEETEVEEVDESEQEEAAEEVAETTDEAEDAAEEAGTETEGETAEEADDAWMKPDGEESDTLHLPDSQAAKIRRKYKGQVKEERDRNAALEARIKELEQGTQSRVVPMDTGKPKREDYKTDDEWVEALVDHKHKATEQQYQSRQAKQQQEAARAQEETRIQSAVDKHYVRAEKLATKSGIKPETYQAADLKFRGAIEDIFPGAGDQVTDMLIASMGEGSEKAIYHLAVNDKKRYEFLATFKEDTKGLAASVYLGKLAAQLSVPTKRDSTTPTPGTRLNGDKSSKVKEIATHKAFKEAEKKRDTQEMFNIKKRAKEQKIDVSGW